MLIVLLGHRVGVGGRVLTGLGERSVWKRAKRRNYGPIKNHSAGLAAAPNEQSGRGRTASQRDGAGAESAPFLSAIAGKNTRDPHVDGHT